MDRMYAYVSDIPGLYELELPDGRQLLDMTGGQIAYLVSKYRCPVEFVFRGPEVHYIPLKGLFI